MPNLPTLDRVRALERGDRVRATRDLTHVCGAKRGEYGVVFEPADFHEPNTGPMVRWFYGTCCNVYDNDVERVDP